MAGYFFYMKYDKFPIDVASQIQLLEKRELEIPDKDKASHYLNTISYFRLSAYMRFFQSDDGKHSFSNDTTFDNILDLYSFDRELRLLIFDAIERIEIAVRAQIINQLSVNHGANWYEDPTLFWNDKNFNHGDFLSKVEEEKKRANEQFLKHYAATYDNPVNPPCWMLFEILSMTTISFLYIAIKDNGNHKKAITSHFNLTDVIFISWLHSLCHVRNICAHHGRLWNRFFIIKPLLPNRPKHKFLKQTDDLDSRKLYVTLCCIQRLLESINPTSHYKAKLKALIDKYPKVSIAEMGFPHEWLSEPLWN